MKRKGMLLSAIVAVLLSICFVSCSKDDEMGIGSSAGEIVEPRSAVVDNPDVKERD